MYVHRALLGVLFVGLFATLALPVPAAAEFRPAAPLVAVLTGAAEAPGPGDPDGSGFALITLNVGRAEVCFFLAVQDIAPATAAHIHVAPVGVPGPVVVPLAPPTQGTSSGCTSADRHLVQAILLDPASYYVNVHNAEYPAGAIRGQLSLPGP
jgi:hypothetical protein